MDSLVYPSQSYPRVNIPGISTCGDPSVIDYLGTTRYSISAFNRDLDDIQTSQLLDAGGNGEYKSLGMPSEVDISLGVGAEYSSNY